MNISRLHSLFEQLQHLSLMLVLAVLRMSIINLLCLLEQAVKDDSGKGITVYIPNSITSSLFLPYKTVCCLVEQRSTQLQTLSSIDTNVILMYFADHLDGIIWFWAARAAGDIPCICPPLARDLD
jgi:hypothetical protein